MLKKIFNFLVNLLNFNKLLPRIRKYFFWYVLKPKKIKVLNQDIFLVTESKNNNSNIFYGNLPSRDLYAYRQDYNNAEQKIILSKVKKNYNCIDIGANIGFFSILFLKANNFKGKVYSFEACRQTFNKLKKNLSHFDNINLFYGYVGNGKKFLVIDKLITKKINFIKVDIDGCDLLALKGCKKIIKKHKPKILFEISENSKRQFNIHYLDMINFLKKYNYKIYEFKLYKNKIKYVPFKRNLKNEEVINLYAENI